MIFGVGGGELRLISLSLMIFWCIPGLVFEKKKGEGGCFGEKRKGEVGFFFITSQFSSRLLTEILDVRNIDFEKKRP